MQIKAKKIFAGLMASVMTVCTLSSVYADAASFSYNDDGIVKSGSLYLSAESHVSATTYVNKDVNCSVSLTVEYYEKKHKTKEYIKSAGQSEIANAMVRIPIPDGCYCDKATSEHRCDYYNFAKTLTEPKSN